VGENFTEVPNYHETAELIEHQKKSRRKANAAIYMANMRETFWQEGEGGEGKAKREIDVPEGVPKWSW
jgi:hypothetical protein